MKRWLLGFAVLIAASAAAVALFTGPRMRVQPHIRAFQVPMPLPPPGAVAAYPPPGYDPAALTNRPAATPEALARGQVYYAYYCQFCHGATGAGDGPVGQSDTLAPPDLRTAAMQARTDADLLRAMVSGRVHAPVLARVVPTAYRPYLVLHLRALSAEKLPTLP